MTRKEGEGERLRELYWGNLPGMEWENVDQNICGIVKMSLRRALGSYWEHGSLQAKLPPGEARDIC